MAAVATDITETDNTDYADREYTDITDTEDTLPFKISDGEYLVKDYFAAKINKPDKGEAHLALTNKRAIIYYWTHKTFMVNGANISEVTATDVLWTKRQDRSKGGILLGIGLIGLFLSIVFPYIIDYDELYFQSPVSIVPIGISAFLTMLGIYYIFKSRYTFIVTLYIRSVTGAISLHNYPLSGNNSLPKHSHLELDADPGPDAKLLAEELGAYILNIQRVLINA